MPDDWPVGCFARNEPHFDARVERALGQCRFIFEHLKDTHRDNIAFAGNRLALAPPDERIGPKDGDHDARPGWRMRGHELGMRVVVDPPRRAVR